MRISHFIKGMALFIPLFLSSCNDEEQALNESKCKIICSVDKFESDNQSRTTTDPNNNFKITWASGDVIGIFPREGYQEPFEIPASQANSSSASFDGGYWDVKEGLQYNAYYPFDKKNFDSAEMKTKIPVSYVGQSQNGTSCDIGAYDYTYSDWNTATNGNVSFDFHHIGAIAVFSLKYPATTTYTKLTVSVDEAVIPLTGTYDLTAENVSMIPAESGLSNSISLDLTNCSGVAGETGTFYMMLPPMDLSSNEVTLTLTSSAGTVCTYTIEGTLNIEKSRLYRIAGVPQESKVEGTIDEWDDVVKTVTLTEAGTLSSLLTADEKLNLTSLKVVGPLNGTDIKYLREMICQRDPGGNETTGNIVSLNLSEASIVEGGDAYSYSYATGAGDITEACYTSNNILGNGMFSRCVYLQSVILPNNIVSIGTNAFYGCVALSSISFPSNMISIEQNAFANCGGLKSLTIPDNIISIGEGAFYNCNQLTSVNLPQNLTTISDNIFAHCNDLNSITIPDNFVSIGNRAFYYCEMSKIIIGKNVEIISESAFECNSIIECYCHATTPPLLESNSFAYSIKEGAILYVPTDCASVYNSSAWGSLFTNIVEMD